MKAMISIFGVFVISLSSYSQTSTISDGEWTDVSIWSSGLPGNEVANILNDVNLDFAINIGTSADYIITGSLTDTAGGSTYTIILNQDANFDIDGNVTTEGNFAMRNSSTVTIRSFDTLRVSGNFFCDQTAILTMEPFSALLIDGDMTMRNNSTALIDGNIVVGGNFLSRNSSNMAGSGNMEVAGTITIENSASIFGTTSDCTPGPCEYGSGIGLPIKLMSFTANEYTDNNLRIDWSTHSEINNEFFQIEISSNGFEYETIADISGAGNSQEVLKYSILRPNPFDNVNKVYLRLTQFDYDGQSETFNPIVVDLNKSSSSFILNSNKLNIYPNPNLGEKFNIRLKEVTIGNLLIEIIDISGRRVHSEEIFISDSNAEMKVQINPGTSLKAGIYLLRIKSNNYEVSERFSVNK